MTSISFDLINRVKYQLCQSQKWQYHLCGDELCARRYTCIHKKLEIINRKEEKKSGSCEGNWGIWPKWHYAITTWPRRPLSKSAPNLKLIQYSTRSYYIEALKSILHQLWSMPSWYFWKNATFLLKTLCVAIGCFMWKMGFLALFLKPLDYFF